MPSVGREWESTLKCDEDGDQVIRNRKEKEGEKEWIEREEEDAEYKKRCEFWK